MQLLVRAGFSKSLADFRDDCAPKKLHWAQKSEEVVEMQVVENSRQLSKINLYFPLCLIGIANDFDPIQGHHSAVEKLCKLCGLRARFSATFLLLPTLHLGRIRLAQLILSWLRKRFDETLRGVGCAPAVSDLIAQTNIGSSLGEG